MIAPCLQTTGIENGVCQYLGFSSALVNAYSLQFSRKMEKLWRVTNKSPQNVVPQGVGMGLFTTWLEDRPQHFHAIKPWLSIFSFSLTFSGSFAWANNVNHLYNYYHSREFPGPLRKFSGTGMSGITQNHNYYTFLNNFWISFPEITGNDDIPVPETVPRNRTLGKWGTIIFSVPEDSHGPPITASK